MGDWELTSCETCFIWVIVFPLGTLYQFLWGRQRGKISTAKFDRLRTTPPAPEKRKYALSIYPAMKTGLAKSEERSSLGFLDLPPELRNEIYGYYIDREEIRIYRKGDSIRISDRHIDREGSFSDTEERQCVDLLPFLQTCRQIYMEAIPLLYSGKTFRFSSPSTFVSFFASVLPQRSALISEVVIEFEFDTNSLEIDPLTRYQDLPPGPPILRQLPLLGIKNRENFCNLACRLVKTLPKLRRFKFEVKNAPHPIFDYRFRRTFHGFNYLPVDGLDISMEVTGIVSGRTFQWHFGEGEAVLVNSSGGITLSKEVDRKKTPWEEIQTFKKDLESIGYYR